MTYVANFDTHPHIAYDDLENLYWGQYGYRVSIEMPLARRRRYKTQMGYRRGLAEMLNRVEYGNAEVVYRSNDIGHNFFFEDALAAQQFIDANAATVKKVVRPVATEEIDILRQGDVIIRAKKYHNLYSYRLSFANCDDDQIDSFVEEMIYEVGQTSRKLTARSMYDRNLRVLFLRDEADVILTKMAIDDELIFSIKRVVQRVAKS